MSTATSFSYQRIKSHFEAKGFEVWLMCHRSQTPHTLSVYHKGVYKTLMAFRVNERTGEINAAHFKDVVHRYATGQPLIHPHTGKVEAA